ncbi:uncharacterized protein [Brachionichthys hirsutus]|uniref:uncharacterized protein isoform X2 n=1 Tax=Brachionichthys hirsutus TaxID=412623 RepID=UPI003604EE1A
MEDEKETAEEKEEEEEEEKEPRHIAVAETSAEYPNLPIMHWEDLSQWISELEKQEQERRERSKRVTAVRLEEGQGGVWRGVWEEEEEDYRRCRMTQRFHHRRNLQLCFINNSDSDEEEEGSKKKVAMAMGRNGGHGLKQEVASALRTLRDKLLAEQKEKEVNGKKEGWEGIAVRATGRQQCRCQAETSGAVGAAGVSSAAAQQLESITSKGRARIVWIRPDEAPSLLRFLINDGTFLSQTSRFDLLNARDRR